jgi:hypothetical protein
MSRRPAVKPRPDVQSGLAIAEKTRSPTLPFSAGKTLVTAIKPDLANMKYLGAT